MIATFDTVLAEAPSLPESPHVMKPHSSTLPITRDLETKQLHEVRHRIDGVRSGRVSTIPGEQVFREIQQSLAARRSS